MRKLFGLLIAISFALGGTYMMWPGPFAARWNSWIALAEHRISAELATIDQIQSGKLKIGEAPARTRPLAPPQEPVPPTGHRRAATSEKNTTRKITTPPVAEPSETVPNTKQSVPVNPVAPANTPPEAALGAILKHETRGNQTKEETFWTEERIQEALKNGPPKSRGAPCIAFCDKNNTVGDFNTTKAPPAPP